MLYYSSMQILMKRRDRNDTMIMKQYIIKGGQPLRGEVYIGGAKNAALGIIVAAIMADEPVTIENLPDVDDVKVLLEAIE